MNPMRLYKFTMLDESVHHAMMINSDNVPWATCPCGGVVLSSTSLAEGRTSEYKSRCLTTSKQFTDERVAPG